MKTLKYLSLMLFMLVGLGLASCDKDDGLVNTDNLPAAAKSFLSTYYPGVKILYAEKDYDDGHKEYEVDLTNGHSVTFNKDGEWLDVDAPQGQTIPAGIAPEKIVNFIATDFNGVGINEISRNFRGHIGYEVELVNGVDLNFNIDGDYIGVDY